MYMMSRINKFPSWKTRAIVEIKSQKGYLEDVKLSTTKKGSCHGSTKLLHIKGIESNCQKCISKKGSLEAVKLSLI